MKTNWIADDKLAECLERNDAFWNGEFKDGPLMWVTVPDAKAGTPPAEPDTEEKMWTDVDSRSLESTLITDGGSYILKC
jgi:hypothetical protein